jgi:hypothetical protein
MKTQPRNYLVVHPLNSRNADLERLASKFALECYDGMNVGHPPPTPGNPTAP